MVYQTKFSIGSMVVDKKNDRYGTVRNVRIEDDGPELTPKIQYNIAPKFKPVNWVSEENLVEVVIKEAV